MRIIPFVAPLAVLALSSAPVASAGGIAGGGGPPSMNVFKLHLVLDLSLTSEIALNWDGVLPHTVDVANLEGETRSYQVHAGDRPGTYLLLDRREVIRAAARNKS